MPPRFARLSATSLDIINPDHDQLGDALAAGAGDRAPDCDSDLGGYSLTEIAKELRITRRRVLDRLDELRDELERL